jgi:hypothetical protein
VAAATPPARSAIGTFDRPTGAERLHALGAEPIVFDLLDPRAVRKAVVDT